MCLHRLEKYRAWGPLLIRVLVGAIFLVSGIQKVFFGQAHFFTMMTPWAGSMAVPLGYFVGAVEIVAGAMLIIGWWVRYAAIPLAIDMLVASLTVTLPHGWNSGRFTVLLLFSVLALMFTGGGKWSCDWPRTDMHGKPRKK